MALRDHLGGDSKISDNDLQRPPGTLNHKPTMAGGEPTSVRWLIEPDGTRVDVHTLGFCTAHCANLERCASWRCDSHKSS
ncbi:MAG: hypothetical protein ACPGVG_15980 [Mycobacterium sp.]